MTNLLARRMARGFAALALLAGFAVAPAQAQTNVTTGGGEVRAFLARSTVIYAATYGGGLVQSTNTGTSWTRVTTTANNPRYFTGIAGGTSGYFVLGGDEGLLRTNDGVTFTQVLFEPVSAVAVSGTVVLAGVRGVGILRSTDSGASFALVNNAALTSLDIVAIAEDPTNANRFALAARPDGQGNKGGIFDSVDGGQTWAADGNFVIASGTRYVSSIAFNSAGSLYAGVLQPDSAGDVYFRSGSAWTATGDVFGVASLHRDANTAGLIWAGTRASGVMNGTGAAFNYGFNQNNTPSIISTGVNAVATIPGNANVVLQALRGAGVWRSAVIASPRTWARVNLPGSDRVLSATGISTGGAVILAGLYAGGVWRSADGVNFNPPVTAGTTPAGFAFSAANDANSTDPFLSIWELSASTTNANLIYAAAGGNGMFYFNNGVGVFRFNGTCWGAVGSSGVPASGNCAGTTEAGLPFGSTQVFGVTVNPTNDQIAYASFMGGGLGTYARFSGSWSLSALGPVLTPQMRGVVAAANGTRVIGLPFDDKPILSTNQGSTFGATSVSQTGFERLRFFSAAENPTATTQWVAGTNKGIFRSTDSGNTWTRVSGGPFLKLAITAVGFKSTGRAFAGDFDGNRYCSNNGGASWSVLAPALRAGVNAIRVVGGNLYYLTDGGGLFLETGSC